MVKTIHSLYMQDGGVKGSWPPSSLLKAQQICRRVSGSSSVLRDGERVLLHFRERNLFGLSISRQFANSCCSSLQTKGHFLITLQHLALLGPMSLLRNEVAPIIKKPSSHIIELCASTRLSLQGTQCTVPPSPATGFLCAHLFDTWLGTGWFRE